MTEQQWADARELWPFERKKAPRKYVSPQWGAHYPKHRVDEVEVVWTDREIKEAWKESITSET